MIVLYIAIAILVFGILIAIHEFGHFFTAKLLGVKVNEFAIGMGPAIIKRQRGETVYAWRAVPIGGFCSMEGENESSEDPRAFTSQKAWKRLIILVAGSFMNFILGLVIIFFLYVGAESFYTPVITDFMDGFALQGESGLMEGDEIASIDGERVYVYSDLSLLFERGNGESFDLVVKRNGEKITLEDFPLIRREYVYEGETGQYYGLVFGTEKATFGAKLEYSFKNAIDFVRIVRMSLNDLIRGRASVRDLSGPVGIVGFMADIGETSGSTRAALENIIYFAALIAINLAVMNMLPLPALDGGRVFFVVVTWVIEKIRRKRVNPKYEAYIHMAGLALFILLMVFVTFNDVFKLVVGGGA